jgi:hypothetical protein
MRIIPHQLRSKNLVPFKKRHGRYNIPGMTSESHVSMDRVDNDLSTEEQTYIRHYLGYADALIRSAEENAPSPNLEIDVSESAVSGNEPAVSANDLPKDQQPLDPVPAVIATDPTPDKQDPKEKAA